ncbi:hypothetical protein [Actinomadura formosensis]|uniref:hypothetical protein n=1 Tax=Actinomadura formosensis TaxID=60706 RepID=UPI003D91D731
MRDLSETDPEKMLSSLRQSRRSSAVTEFEGVMSSRWCSPRQSQAGLGEAAVDQMAAVLDTAQTSPHRGDQVLGIDKDRVGRQANAAMETRRAERPRTRATGV